MIIFIFNKGSLKIIPPIPGKAIIAKSLYLIKPTMLGDGNIAIVVRLKALCI